MTGKLNATHFAIVYVKYLSMLQLDEQVLAIPRLPKQRAYE